MPASANEAVPPPDVPSWALVEVDVATAAPTEGAEAAAEGLVEELETCEDIARGRLAMGWTEAADEAAAAETVGVAVDEVEAEDGDEMLVDTSPVAAGTGPQGGLATAPRVQGAAGDVDHPPALPPLPFTDYSYTGRTAGYVIADATQRLDALAKRVAIYCRQKAAQLRHVGGAGASLADVGGGRGRDLDASPASLPSGSATSSPYAAEAPLRPPPPRLDAEVPPSMAKSEASIAQQAAEAAAADLAVTWRMVAAAVTSSAPATLTSASPCASPAFIALIRRLLDVADGQVAEHTTAAHSGAAAAAAADAVALTLACTRASHRYFNLRELPPRERADVARAVEATEAWHARNATKPPQWVVQRQRGGSGGDDDEPDAPPPPRSFTDLHGTGTAALDSAALSPSAVPSDLLAADAAATRATTTEDDELRRGKMVVARERSDARRARKRCVRVLGSCCRLLQLL